MSSLPSLLFPYLVGIVSSVVVLIVAIWTYFVCAKRVARLPEATRWEHLSSLVEDLELDHDRLKEDVFNAKRTIEEAQRQEGRLTEIEDALRTKEQDYAELQRVQAEYAQTSGQLAADREEVARLTAEKAKAEFEREALRDDSQRLEQRLGEQRAESSRLDERVEELRKTKDEVRESVDALRLEAGQLGVQVAELTARKGSLEAQVEGMARRVEELDRSIADLKKRNEALTDEHEKLSAACARVRRELGEGRSELAMREEELEKLKAELSSQAEGLSAIRKRHDQAARELENLEARKDSLQQQVEALEKTKHEFQELRKRQRALEAEIAGLEASAQQKKDRLAELRREVGTRDPTSANADEVLKDLWVPAITPREYGPDPATDPSEAECLANVRNYLQDLGLRFPERVVDALHTSLKCAADAPLLVLAGISGTGKSLLPRRYAEAMGIHFLNVPVQPRWDGPQDLLGFYNYLENRYKGTDLLRALLQMDAISRSWMPKDFMKESTNKHLLLVLLDEMNLARVEYYFSEFLSRLETRRDIDLSNPHDLRKAEIPIEVGRLDSINDDDPLRVLAGDNVFFAGTINEDESALSLSDKVIDRANIMRFGRPRNLADLPPAAADRALEHRASRPLPRSAWQTWLEAGRKNAVDDRYEGMIGALNDALEQVGRPFGYRTRRAILSYLQMYPDQSESGHDAALADQIEQRVLPKLRGVDVTEQAGKRAIDDVKDVIAAVSDDELLAAVERGAELTTGHLFVWAGVDRDK